MKRGTTDHPKLLALATTLKVPRTQAAGILEFLWAFASRFAPMGDVGKYQDTAIARALDWHRAPSQLVSALTECGWLDSCSEHRLIIHDWEDHADQAVKKYLQRKKLSFAKPVSIQVQTKSAEIKLTINHQPLTINHTSARSDRTDLDGQPRACPLAEYGWKGGWKFVGQADDALCERIALIPESVFPESPDLDSPYMIRARLLWFDEFWMEYWLAKGKKKSREAYFKRVRTLELHDRIVAAVTAQTAEMMQRPPDKRPHATTWLNGERWNDEATQPPTQELFG